MEAEILCLWFAQQSGFEERERNSSWGIIILSKIYISTNHKHSNKYKSHTLANSRPDLVQHGDSQLPEHLGPLVIEEEDTGGGVGLGHELGDPVLNAL